MAPQGNPPPYAFMQRMYRSNLRPVVFVCTLASAVWTLVWAVGLFKEIHTDKSNGNTKLSDFAIALGVMYIVTTLFESIGVVGSILQRAPIVILYAWLSIGSGLLVFAGGLLRIIAHFMLKDELITECTTLATNGTVDFRWGIWGSETTEQLSPSQASTWCNKAWSHDSWSEIISLLIEIVLMAALSFLAFGYYSQLVDPTSPVNNPRRPQPNAFNPSVNPYSGNAPYNGGYYGYNSSANLNVNAGAPGGLYNPPYLGYNDPSQNRRGSMEGFVPPAGPPPGWKGSDSDAELMAPGKDGDVDKVPAYEAGGYGIGVGERDAKMFRGDSASERTVVAHGGDGDGKDLADENPFDDFESGRQERALREHETGRSQGRF